jgi:hypothetical protein
MNIQVTWDNSDQQNTIRVTLNNADAWSEIEDAYKAVYAMMDNAGQWVDVIIDVTDAPGPAKPAAFIALVRAYLNAPSNAGACVLIGASQTVRVLAHNFIQSGDWHYRILFAETLTEARMRLSERLTEHKPSMQRAWSFAS